MDAKVGGIRFGKGVELGEQSGSGGKGGAIGDGFEAVVVGITGGGGLQACEAIGGRAGIDGEPADGFGGMGCAIEAFLFLHGELEATGADSFGAGDHPIAVCEGLHLGENSRCCREGIGEGKGLETCGTELAGGGCASGEACAIGEFPIAGF